MKGHSHEVAEHSFDKTGPKSTPSSAAAQRAAGAETYALPLAPCEDLHDPPPRGPLSSAVSGGTGIDLHSKLGSMLSGRSSVRSRRSDPSNPTQR